MNKVKSWVNTHKKQTILIVVAIILILATITATAMLNQPKPVSNDTSTTTSVKENVSKPQTENTSKTDPKPDDTTTNPEPKTESSTVESETKPTESTPSHTTSKPVWVEEQGHYEDVTEQVWVENWVTEEIEPGYTEYVINGQDCIFTDGTTFHTATDGWDAITAYQKKLVIMGLPSFYTTIPHYEPVEHPAVTKQVDKGYYETRVVGRKWVVDIPGHWA